MVAYLCVRDWPRVGEVEAAAAAGPGTVLQEPVERVRHGQADTVLVSIPVLDGCHLRFYKPRVRRPGPQVLALDAPTAGGRELVHRSHRHGILAVTVPVPAQLLHRSDASIPRQGAA